MNAPARTSSGDSRTVSAVSVVAHPNIALAKYWGKRAGGVNVPAVPSLSVTLAGLATRTRIAFPAGLTADRLILGGEEQNGEPVQRVAKLLDSVRAHAGKTVFAEVTTSNDFPTASGLASSASGFAALALAAARAYGLPWDTARVSDLARRGSASAARSLFGGFVELDPGPIGAEGRGEADALLAARPVAPGDHLDLRVLVCVTSEAKKDTGSRDGMRITAEKSPYYAAWLDDAPRTFRAIKDALLAKDFPRLGELAEASALAMHASAIAAGVVYFRGVTLEALAALRELRAKGTAAFATMDAGPHVKVLVQSKDAALVGTWMRAVPGVLRVLEAEPGEGARVVDAKADAWTHGSGQAPAKSELTEGAR
jgi:diphosphomevalonate decarboxylase